MPRRENKTPFVSVIIPVRDDTPRLLICLAALQRQTYPPASFEVIVVDNGSAESVRDRAGEREGLRVIQELQIGSYAARNAGAAVARGEILGFTDADCIPDETWIERAVDHLTERPGVHVAGRIRVFASPGRRAPTAVELYEVLFAFPQQRFVEVFRFGATASLFVRRKDFDAVGGFRAELQSGGDYDLGYRLHKSGVPVVYCAEAIVDHPARRDWRSLRAKIVRVEEGRRQLRSLRVLPPDVVVADPAYAWKAFGRLWRTRLSLRQKIGVQIVYLRAKAAALLAARGFGRRLATVRSERPEGVRLADSPAGGLAMRNEMIGAIVRRAIEHPEFRRRLVESPEEALESHGFALESAELEEIEKIRDTIGTDGEDVEQRLVGIAEQYGVQPRPGE